MKQTEEEIVSSIIDLINKELCTEEAKKEFPYEFSHKITRKKKTKEGKTSVIPYTYNTPQGPQETKTYRTLYIYAHNTEDNSRLTLFEETFVSSNPSTFLNAHYRNTLYRMILKNALTVLLVTKINHLQEEQTTNNILKPV